MLYRIRVWDGLFSISVIKLYMIRVWEGLFSIWVIMLYRIRLWGVCSLSGQLCCIGFGCGRVCSLSR